PLLWGRRGGKAIRFPETNCRIICAVIRQTVGPVTGQERVAIRASLGRVLAQDVRSLINVPSHTNSAMAGYALAGDALPNDGTRSFQIVGTAWAGRPYTGNVAPEQCVRIMTGAAMPDGTDTVVIQEHVDADDKHATIDARHQAGQNVRQAGEDIAAGELALTAGRRITPADLGLMASLGIVEVQVFRKLRVAFFSTGDELRSLGDMLGAGEIYDSNRYTLYGMLQQLGVEVVDLGVVRDQRDATFGAFAEAARCADVVISSGGVSVGEADYVKEALEQLGEIKFWKVATKPGRPLAFGQIRDAVLFGLPGNPVSVMVTFYLFVQPALRRMMGEQVTEPILFNARCESKLKKRPGRTEYQRGILRRDEQGDLVVQKTGMQGSGILTSMSLANCFIILPLEANAVQPGETVTVLPFSGLH
ncbi:MAG: molybdenum cofactor synthesis domain-containing protein, partial [Saprospiraceae bacterium]|nr:molybdenum cofactor synthesis domain-containing protein [Saprospiraceae bacterium]